MSDATSDNELCNLSGNDGDDITGIHDGERDESSDDDDEENKRDGRRNSNNSNQQVRFKCSQCDNSYSRETYLKVHQLCHLGKSFSND